jgi:hypothetical protein
MGKLRRNGASLAVLTLTAGVTLTATAGSSAASATATARPLATPATQAAATNPFVQVLVRRSSLSSLGSGVAKPPPGTKGPETPPNFGGIEPDAAVIRATNRSHSIRPDVHSVTAAAVKNGLPVPVVSSSTVSGSQPGLGTSFEGINLYQERYVAANGNQFQFEPPDQGMCVGNGFVLETINTTLRVFSTSGTPLTDPVALNGFYGYKPAINRTTGIIGPELTDPSCFYDSINGRWIHLVLTLDTKPKTGALTLNNHLDIAVSRTNDPRGAWDFYSVNATDDGRDGTPKHKDCPCVGDYPHIGADRNGIYITTNEYPWSSAPGVFGTNFNGAQLYVFSRQELTSGAARVHSLHFENLALTGGKHPIPAFTLIPANSPDGVFSDANGGSEYLLSTTAAAETGNAAGRSNTIGFWTVSNTSSLNKAKPALKVAKTVVTSEVYGIPPVSEQKLGNVPLRDCLVIECMPDVGPSPTEVEGPLDSSDTRIFNTWFANGRIWGGLSTIVQVAGNLQAGSAWFSLTPAGNIAAQGYVAVAHNNVIYPAIATLANGSGAMAIDLVGHDFFPTAAYAMVQPTGVGAVNLASPGVGPEDGFCEYDFENCAVTNPPMKRPRWGDYSAAQASGNSIWLGSEYIAQTCTLRQFEADFTCGQTRGSAANWSTRLSRVTP